MNFKDQVVKAMQELPEDATPEDAMEKILVLDKIRRGIEQVEAGRVVSQEDAERRLSKWLR